LRRRLVALLPLPPVRLFLFSFFERRGFRWTEEGQGQVSWRRPRGGRFGGFFFFFPFWSCHRPRRSRGGLEDVGGAWPRFFFFFFFFFFPWIDDCVGTIGQRRRGELVAPVPFAGFWSIGSRRPAAWPTQRSRFVGGSSVAHCDKGVKTPFPFARFFFFFFLFFFFPSFLCPGPGNAATAERPTEIVSAGPPPPPERLFPFSLCLAKTESIRVYRGRVLGASVLPLSPVRSFFFFSSPSAIEGSTPLNVPRLRLTYVRRGSLSCNHMRGFEPTCTWSLEGQAGAFFLFFSSPFFFLPPPLPVGGH